jgi:hypothetical protein
MKIYRIESESGIGMYNYRDDLWGRATNDASTGRQPGPWGDGITDFHDGHHFGFSSKAQLKRWVHKKKWRQAMAALGGKVVVLKVPNEHTIRGRSQVVFIKDYAEKIAEIPVDLI